MNNKLLLVFLFSLIIIGNLNFIIAQEDSAQSHSFILRLDTHYYKDGQEILNYNENISHDGIVLDIYAQNKDNLSRIIDLQIVKVSPELEGKFSNDTKTLIFKETKLLWKSDFIDTTSFNNINTFLFVGVEGQNEMLSMVFYTEAQATYTKGGLVKSLNNQGIDIQSLLDKIGKWLYPQNPKTGIYIFIALVVLVIFVIWRQEWVKKLEEWRRK